MGNLLQIVGALLVLAGFILTQAGRLDERAWPYLLLNLAGSGILAVLAFADRRWGFLLLEGAWFVVTLVAIAVKLRARGPLSP
jgi:hypothetical protein